MKPYLLTTPLAAGLLLLGTLGCSKKDEPAASNTGSYQLDSAARTCQATASVTTASSGGLSIDYLAIDLVTTPQPATGEQLLHLYFAKPNVQGNNTYTLRTIQYMPTSSSSPYYFSVDAASVTSTSSGGFSGTFSGKIINSITGGTPAPYTTITSGTFTNVRP